MSERGLWNELLFGVGLKVWTMYYVLMCFERQPTSSGGSRILKRGFPVRSKEAREVRPL